VKKIVIKSAFAEFSLPCLDADQFPSYQEEKIQCNFIMDSNQLNYLLLKTKHAISTDDARYYLNGGYLHMAQSNNRKVIRLVSTDSHRLALAEASMPENRFSMPNIILPTKCINELCKLIESNPASINIGVSKHMIKFVIADTTLVSKLIDARFPDYERVIPCENRNLLRARASEVIKAIDLVTTVSLAKPKSVKLKLQMNKLILIVRDKIHSSAVVEVSAYYNGTEMEVSFNAKYLLDVLSIIKGPNVMFYFKQGSSSVLVEDSNNKDCKFVLMSLRI
jgi:DNA polymerase-3 subunit beta